MRRDGEEITATGARIVAVGTGDARYARAFIEDERFPYLVLLDEDGTAADVASVRRGGAWALSGPKSIAHGAKSFFRGYRQKKIGKRPTQLGATFVIGPDDDVRYEHLDRDIVDHAPLAEIVAAVQR